MLLLFTLCETHWAFLEQQSNLWWNMNLQLSLSNTMGHISIVVGPLKMWLVGGGSFNSLFLVPFHDYLSLVNKDPFRAYWEGLSLKISSFTENCSKNTHCECRKWLQNSVTWTFSIRFYCLEPRYCFLKMIFKEASDIKFGNGMSFDSKIEETSY